jgi:type IV pilus assembly protein PilA
MARPIALSFRVRGYTVIELAILTAVTTIVGAVVYSAWRTHAVRLQVDDGIAAAMGARDAVAREFRTSGEVPATEAEARVPARPNGGDRFVASMAIENGRIDIIFGGEADAEIAGRRISLTPYETASPEIVWLCGNEIPGPGLQPLGFAGGGRQAQQIPTTIEARFLPPNCR